MIRVLLVSRSSEFWSHFQSALNEHGARITHIEQGGNVIFAVKKGRFDLLIVDEAPGDICGLELIKAVVAINPMLNCAVVSSLSPEDFHEASEGLGIMMQLPVKPGKKEADQLLNHLSKIHALDVNFSRRVT